MSTTLLETVNSPAVRVDREAGIVRGVKFLGRKSANRRTYSDRALADAKDLYESAVINIDHDRKEPRRERGFMEGFAFPTSVEIRGDGVYGNLQCIMSHPYSPVFLEWAETAPDRLGLSHNAEGIEKPDGNGGSLIESLTLVRSIDVVRNPATAAGLFESRDSAPSRRSFRELLESDPMPTPADQVADQSQQVDDAVADALDEFLPADSYFGLKFQGEKSIGRAFESAAAMITKDGTATNSVKTKALSDLLSAKDDAVAAFTTILSRFKDPLDRTEPDDSTPAPKLESRFTDCRHDGRTFAERIRMSG